MNTELLSSIAMHLMTGDKVELSGERLPIRRIGQQRLKSVSFSIQSREHVATEQNPRKAQPLGSACEERSRRGAVQGREEGQIHCRRRGRKK
jgi:hypothetical protein